MWNYRLVKKGKETSIREVYYKKDGTIYLWTKTPIFLAAINKTELREDLHLILKAFDKPILKEVKNTLK